MEPSTPLPTYTIVIAKYKEDISWIEELQKENIVIYDKSGEQNPNPPIGIKQYMQRPNIGREGETFLYYILMNYDNLTDYIVFLQGNPFDHTGEINTPKKLQNKINDHIQQQNIQIFGFGQFIDQCEYHYNMRFQDYCNLLFDNQNYSTICGFNAGCQYIIPKEYILSRPKQFYSRLYSMIINTPEYINYDMIHYGGIYNPNFITGWCLERFFALIVGFKNIPINPRFLLESG